MSFDRAVLGRTGIEVGRIGLASSYGAPAGTVELAFDQGVSYFYRGSLRRNPFGEGLRRLAPKRDRFLLVTQSYSRLASLIGPSLERAYETITRQVWDTSSGQCVRTSEARTVANPDWHSHSLAMRFVPSGTRIFFGTRPNATDSWDIS
jgi:hypothetical protein